MQWGSEDLIGYHHVYGFIGWGAFYRVYISKAEGLKLKHGTFLQQQQCIWVRTNRFEQDQTKSAGTIWEGTALQKSQHDMKKYDSQNIRPRSWEQTEKKLHRNTKCQTLWEEASQEHLCCRTYRLHCDWTRPSREGRQWTYSLHSESTSPCRVCCCCTAEREGGWESNTWDHHAPDYAAWFLTKQNDLRKNTDNLKWHLEV